MEYKLELEQFQGPLDLLLSLIEQKEMDISQVAIADVTDGYLSYLDKAKDISATELADFLVVATKLLVIKSKTLIPQLADDEDDSAEQLEAQLKMYKDYLDASVYIEKLLSKDSILFSRDKIAYQFEPTFSPPKELKASDLEEIYNEILKRIDYVVNLPQRVMKKTITLKEKVTGIREAIKKVKKMNFRDVLSGASDRTEVVVSFMALLELIKSGEIAVNQKGVFDDIYVEKS
jgi:segregation and condensation protein A